MLADDYSKVQRLEWDYGSMDTHESGDYVHYEDYLDLLEAYEELKWRMEGLEK